MAKREWRHAETCWAILVEGWPSNHPCFASEKHASGLAAPRLFANRQDAIEDIDAHPGSDGVPVRVLITEA